MIDIRVINFSTRSTGHDSFDLNFGDVGKAEFQSPRSLAYVIDWQLSKRRSGTAQTKIMSEISGTTAKPHKQKGTGHARQGSKRSVQFRGGRTCFGPRFRSFEYKIPRKIVKVAITDVMKMKFMEGKVIFFSEFGDIVKTSIVHKILKENAVESALFLYDSKMGYESSLSRSTGNIKNSKVMDFRALNVYDALRFDFIILDKSLFSQVKKVVGN